MEQLIVPQYEQRALLEHSNEIFSLLIELGYICDLLVQHACYYQTCLS